MWEVNPKKVETYRKSLFWSAAKLARRADLSHETVHRIEKGKVRFIKDETVNKLAHALDVSANDILKEPREWAKPRRRRPRRKTKADQTSSPETPA